MNRIPPGAKGDYLKVIAVLLAIDRVSSSSFPGLGLKAKPTGETIPVVAK